MKGTQMHPVHAANMVANCGPCGQSQVVHGTENGYQEFYLVVGFHVMFHPSINRKIPALNFSMDNEYYRQFFYIRCTLVGN